MGIVDSKMSVCTLAANFIASLILSLCYKLMTKTYALRLKPGQDLKKAILAFVETNSIEAGWILTCVGSVTDYHIRFANQPNGSKASGHFEIISLSGTLSVNGCHLHIGISDSAGQNIGGHLLDGTIIYTTAEIVLQQSNEIVFTREEDGTTAWRELQIKNK